MSTGVTNEEEPLESVTGPRRGRGGRQFSLSLPSFILSGIFLPSILSHVDRRGVGCEDRPCEAQTRDIEISRGKKLFFSFHFSFLLWVRDLPTISAPVQRFSSRIVARLIFKQVGEDFERSLLIDSSRKSGRRICLFLTISKEGA